MSTPTLEILSAGMGVTIQDLGRPGWKHLGVPVGGAMDQVSAIAANRLVGNPDEAPVLEWLMRGGRVRVLTAARVAITGACAPTGSSSLLSKGEEIAITGTGPGIWSYVAVGGALEAPRFFGSVSTYPRAGLGRCLAAGDRLAADLRTNFPGIAGRFLVPEMRRSFANIPEVRIWPGPQKKEFPADSWSRLIASEWTVSSRSDRVGYRLDGAPLPASKLSMRSEPIVLGSLQVPPDGHPIVTMRDGPTVGGYPKLAIVDEDSLDWLAQVSPGVIFRFMPVCE